MNTKDLSQAKCPELRASFEALKEAGRLARKVAVQTNTGIVIVQDERVVRVSAKELRQSDPSLCE